MKKIISLILRIAVLSVVLSGCSEPFQTIDTDTIKIEQGEAKHSVVITDKTDGNRQYTYKTVRLKKTGEEHTSEAHKSDNLTIITEDKYIIILDKKAGIKYRVKP